MQIFKTVNFGTSKTGLATVGYKLVNYDGSEALARTTTGVFETLTNTGIYGCLITFSDTFQGMIIWDTGDSDIYYASESVDYRQYTQSLGGGGGGYYMTESTWSKEEKEKVLKQLTQIIKLLKDTTLIKEFNALKEENKKDIKNIKLFLQESMSTDIIKIGELEKALEAIVIGIEAILENQEFNLTLQNLDVEGANEIR